MSALQKGSKLVEKFIEGLGVKVSDTVVPTDAGSKRWALNRGSAKILIVVSEDEGAGNVRVVAPVVTLPDAERGRFAEKLLRLNGSDLGESAFGIVGNDAVLITQRSLQDLDSSEVDAMIRGLGKLADDYDDELAGEFNTKRSSDG